MILAARSYVATGAVVLVGVTGQWVGALGPDAWRIPAAAWVLALLVEGLLARGERLVVAREVPARARLGRPVEVALSIANPAAWAVEVEVLDAPPPSVGADREPRRWSIAPGASARRAATIVPRGLGRLAWSTVRTRRLGRFRLAWWPRRLEAPARLEVVPDRLESDEVRAGSRPHGRRESPVVGTGGEIVGLRDYRAGDPLRSIDWKATARRGAPVVRVHRADEHTEMVIALDAGRTSAIRAGDLTRLGHYVNVAARLAERALHHGDHVSLVVHADAPIAIVPAARGPSGLARLRATLAGVAPRPRESNPLAAALEVRRLARHRSLVVMLTDLEEGEAAAQLLRAATLLAPAHLPLLAGLADDEVLDMRWRARASWLGPYEMLAALELERGARGTVLRLRRAGAHVVRARPRELDRRVLDAYAELRARRSV